MNTISASIIAPHIIIEHNRPEDFQTAEDALKKLTSRPNGQHLINELLKKTNSERYVKIKVTSLVNTAARPILTRSQMNRYQLPDSEYSQENNTKANHLAQKKGILKGEGTAVSIFWNPHQSLNIDDKGRPTLINDDSLSFVSLGHELVHGYRMMKGTYTGGSSNRYNPDSAAGQEEARAVGIGKFSSKKMTENSIRKEHGLPLRKQYCLEGNLYSHIQNNSALEVATQKNSINSKENAFNKESDFGVDTYQINSSDHTQTDIFGGYPLNLSYLKADEVSPDNETFQPDREQYKELIKETAITLRKLDNTPTPEDGLRLTEHLQMLQRLGHQDAVYDIITQSRLLNALAAMSGKCFDPSGISSAGSAATVPLWCVAELSRQMLREGKLSASEAINLWFPNGRFISPAWQLLPLRGIANAQQLMESVYVYLIADILNSNTLTPELKTEFFAQFTELAEQLNKDALIGNSALRQALIQRLEEHTGIIIRKKGSVTCMGSGAVILTMKSLPHNIPVPEALSSVNIDSLRKALANRLKAPDQIVSLYDSSSTFFPIQHWKQINEDKNRRFVERCNELSCYSHNAHKSNIFLADAHKSMKKHYATETRKLLANQQYAQDLQKKALWQAEAANKSAQERAKWMSPDTIKIKASVSQQINSSCSSSKTKNDQGIINDTFFDHLPLPPSDLPESLWIEEIENRLLKLKLPDVPVRQGNAQRTRAMEGIDAAGVPFIKTV